MRRLLCIVFVFCFCVCCFADGPSWAKTASSSGSVLFLAAGTLLPLTRDGSSGREHALRTADALVLSVGFSEGLERITRVRRPDSNARDSFPSSHASAAFAVATMEGEFHPHEAWAWYGGAALIADSRVELHRHHWGDVIAGAALGYGTARWELSTKNGILIKPWMTGSGAGVIASGRF